jgi:hypothetical protein
VFDSSVLFLNSDSNITLPKCNIAEIIFISVSIAFSSKFKLCKQFIVLL